MNLSPQFKLRVSPELKARVEEAAAANGRSINAEVNERLEASFAIGSDLEVMEDRLNHVKALNAMVAFYLHEVVKRVPVSEDPLSNDLMTSIKDFARHLSLGEVGQATYHMHAITGMASRVDPNVLEAAKAERVEASFVETAKENVERIVENNARLFLSEHEAEGRKAKS